MHYGTLSFNKMGSKKCPSQNISKLGSSINSMDYCNLQKKLIDRYSSTDSEHYAEIALNYGAVPFLRPKCFRR